MEKQMKNNKCKNEESKGEKRTEEWKINGGKGIRNEEVKEKKDIVMKKEN